MKILEGIFKRPVTIIFTIIMAIVLGIISTSSMAINLLPDIAFPYLTIQTVYVGASAETIDKKVTAVIEESMQNVSDIHDISTFSLDNASLVMLQFEYGTDTKEKEQEISKKLEEVSLPEECSVPEINEIDFNSKSIFSLTIYSETKDEDYVFEKATKIQEKLRGISGVSNVEMTGSPHQEIKISMINGLEMIAGLLVSEITKDGALDIPLGEINTADNKITINNNSSAETIEEIKNLKMNYSLDFQTRQEIGNVQNTIVELENMTSDEVLKIKEEAQNINKLINRLETSTPLELDDIYNNVSMIKAITNLIDNYSASSLTLMWNTVLSRLFENENFKNMTEDELRQLANDFSLSYELLKWLQDNSALDPVTNQPYAEAKWQIIIDFKNNHPDAITDAEYVNLFYDLEIVSRLEQDENYMSETELTDFIGFARSVNLLSLNNVITKLKNNEQPTNSDYANLFALNNTSKLPITSQTMEFIRDSNFENNLEIFYQYKLNHEHVESQLNPITGELEMIKKGDPISSQDFMDLYNQMQFTQQEGIKLNARLLDFIRNIDTSNNNLSFKVSDVADVEIVSTYSSYAYFNSHKAMQIDIYGSPNSNATAIANEAKEVIKQFNDSDENINVVMLNNQADFISDSLSNALVSLLIGMFLAVAVIYVFLRKVKSSLIIAVSMPLSVLLTLICLYLMGITLNMVSVGGLAVGIGMLVDNSIVVLESITSEKAKGKTVVQASIDGVKLVFGSLIGSTLTSVCVFFPILFINGLTKEVFADLSWAVILSLTFSLLVAILIIPTLFCFFYKKEKEVPLEQEEGKFFTKMKNWYTTNLVKLLKHKGVTILVALGIFIASIGLVFTCNIEFLPSIDQHRIQLTINFDNGDDPAYCEQKTLEAYELIDENIDNIDYMAQSIGKSGLIQTTQTGTILLQLKDDAKPTKDIVEDVRNILYTNNYSQEFEILELDGIVASLTGGMSGVSVTVYGEDVDVLKEISEKISQDVMQKEGIRHVSDNMLNKALTYDIKFNKEALQSYGLDYTTIVQTLRIGLAGYDVSTLEIESKEYNVSVGWKDDTIGTYYDSLEKLIIGFDSNKNPIYLDQVADITLKNGRNVIRKSDGLNILEISVEVYGIDTNTASRYLQDSTKNVLKDYEGYEYSSSGVSYYLTDAFSGLVVALIISFFLLFGIMACLFESLRKPLIIIFSFPFAFTGGFIALAITRVSLNIVSFIGLIMLMGVIINDAIVLNERFDQLREGGLDDKQSVIEGCKQRLRAVLMTTLTTVLALIPMALGLGKGGELMQPLGIIAIGGMTIGTLVTLILIPCAYSTIYRIDFKDPDDKKSKKVKQNKKKKATKKEDSVTQTEILEENETKIAPVNVTD